MRSVWRYFFPEGKHRAQYLQLMRDSEEYRNSDDGAWEYTDMFEYINEQIQVSRRGVELSYISERTIFFC